MFTKNLFSIVSAWYANQENLAPNTTLTAFAHDLSHAIFHLGVSLEDEEKVLNIENFLTEGVCNPELEAFVIEAISDVNSDLLVEYMTFIESLPQTNIHIYGA
jgi:hypothetical protein